MKSATTCQYASCLETCENGVVVTLRTKTPDGETRAEFCCAAHASAALCRLSMDRRQGVVEIPRSWKVR